MLRNFFDRLFAKGLERELLDAYISGELIITEYDIDVLCDYGSVYTPSSAYAVLARSDSPDNPLLTVHKGFHAVFHDNAIEKKSVGPFKVLFRRCRRDILIEENRKTAEQERIKREEFSTIVRQRMLKSK